MIGATDLDIEQGLGLYWNPILSMTALFRASMGVFSRVKSPLNHWDLGSLSARASMRGRHTAHLKRRMTLPASVSLAPVGLH